MTENLLRPEWAGIDSTELRLLLQEHMPGPGQYDVNPESLLADGVSGGTLPDVDPNRLYLPLGRDGCRVSLTYKGDTIVAIEPGPAFDAAEWERIRQDIQSSVLTGPTRVGRNISFSTFRVRGSWRGERSGVQILPPPPDAPDVDHSRMHPFLLEFPIMASGYPLITMHRWGQQYVTISRLLNVLLIGRTSFQPQRGRGQSFWAWVHDDSELTSEWVSEGYFAPFGEAIVDALSPLSDHMLEELDPEPYDAIHGNDSRGLRVPTDLDDAICCYLRLRDDDRAAFDRATFWLDLAFRQWDIAMSASFASLVTAIESLTERGTRHAAHRCPTCGETCTHEAPGPTKLFRDFLETHAPGRSQAKQRNTMYNLRSSILHGSQLMELDQNRALGWDPPWQQQYDLQNMLWELTRISLRHWLRTRDQASTPL